MSQSQPTDGPILPRYPVYIPSKGRADLSQTARFFLKDGTPFRLVVEPPEADAYRERFGEEHVLVLPFHDLGQGSIPARNWIWEHALSEGYERHWQFDDNCQWISRWHQGRRIPMDSRLAIRAVEDFTEQYANVGISGFNYEMFGTGRVPPFRINTHVYSASLFWNRLPYRFRGRYNEDTDLCLQVLSGGFCTIQVNAFLVKKIGTMTTKGGNTDELYAGDGRLKMARALERRWPGVVTVDRRFQRPQHVVNWSRFTTQLEPAENPPEIPDFGLRLVRLKESRKPMQGKLRRYDERRRQVRN